MLQPQNKCLNKYTLQSTTNIPKLVISPPFINMCTDTSFLIIVVVVVCFILKPYIIECEN